MEATRQLPSVEEIIKLLGKQPHSASNDVLSEFLIFGAGLIVGAGIAIFLTPVPGSELRGDLGDLLREIRDRLGVSEPASNGQSAETG